MSSMRSIDLLNDLVPKYLERRGLTVEEPLWEIARSELGGFGIFARRDIEVGEVIFRDAPLVLGPRASLNTPLICVSCYTKEDLRPCDRNCGLFICSDKCQESDSHQEECKLIKKWQQEEIPDDKVIQLIRVLTPIRSLIVDDEDKLVINALKSHKYKQHGFEVDVMKQDLNLTISKEEENYMRFVCTVLDANAFEVVVGNESNQTSLRGLYPLSSLVNHCCSPNTSHVFDDNQIMIVRASKIIPKGAELSHSYSKFTWGTMIRRFHLFRTKHFWCRCDRCKDPTEFGTYMSSILCKECKGRMVPLDPLDHRTNFQCETCKKCLMGDEIVSVTSLLGSTLKTFSNDDLDYIFRFLEQKLPEIVPESNETIIGMKYRLIWILGYYQGYEWPELTEELLRKKYAYCQDLLNLLQLLQLGQCKIKGLILYELYCCLKEFKRRQINSGTNINDKDEMEKILVEIADILLDDVTAPEEVKRLWRT